MLACLAVLRHASYQQETPKPNIRDMPSCKQPAATMINGIQKLVKLLACQTWRTRCNFDVFITDSLGPAQRGQWGLHLVAHSKQANYDHRYTRSRGSCGLLRAWRQQQLRTWCAACRRRTEPVKHRWSRLWLKLEDTAPKRRPRTWLHQPIRIGESFVPQQPKVMCTFLHGKIWDSFSSPSVSALQWFHAPPVPRPHLSKRRLFPGMPERHGATLQWPGKPRLSRAIREKFSSYDFCKFEQIK